MTHEPVALVFGSSGVSGWATTRELLRYPTPTTFSRVIALSNRPLSKEAMLLDDPRLQLVSGVDLTQSVEIVVKAMQEKIADVDKVTHVFFYGGVPVYDDGLGDRSDDPLSAHIHIHDDKQAVEVNGNLVDTALSALKVTSPHITHFAFQTGAKYYGLQLVGQLQPYPSSPVKESQPRIPEPWASRTFYYRQLDIIARHARDAPWTWNEVRPDAIIGYAPTTNAMNLPLILGAYFALWRAVHGPGSAIPIPSTPAGAAALNSDSPASDLARLSIFLGLKEDRASHNGEAYNAAAAAADTYAARWPKLAAEWGLKGVPAVEDATAAADFGKPALEAERWARDRQDVWDGLVQQHGLKPGVLEAIQFDFLFVMMVPEDRVLDVGKMQEAGYTEEQDWLEAYREAWELWVQAKVCSDPHNRNMKEEMVQYM
ncbi:hypothetical protein OF83DRAFT_178312 [Amylostereum chailletii]|nr:hypothetical protein OF83DRAFT_178312 [Amylostereum chailletii]